MGEGGKGDRCKSTKTRERRRGRSLSSGSSGCAAERRVEKEREKEGRAERRKMNNARRSLLGAAQVAALYFSALVACVSPGRDLEAHHVAFSFQRPTLFETCDAVVAGGSFMHATAAGLERLYAAGLRRDPENELRLFYTPGKTGGGKVAVVAVGPDRSAGSRIVIYEADNYLFSRVVGESERDLQERVDSIEIVRSQRTLPGKKLPRIVARLDRLLDEVGPPARDVIYTHPATYSVVWFDSVGGHRCGVHVASGGSSPLRDDLGDILWP